MIAHLRNTLFRYYYRAQALIAPGLKNAQFEYCELLKSKLSTDTGWLDIGCGRRLFPEWMPRADEEQSLLLARVHAIFGIDPDQDSLQDNRFVRFRVLGDSTSLPFANASFDVLTANMVIEHVAQPQALLSEVFRVLKGNGVFIFHTPNKLSYATAMSRLVPKDLKIKLIAFLEDRKEEDVFPTLYRMNTPARVKRLSSEAGFRVLELRRVESSAQLVMLGPLVIFELLWIRLLRFAPFENVRSNLIVVLQKPFESRKTNGERET
jgi:ubiquinone/menaquinone biosynthesis C-methylase UbiE